MTFLDFHEQQAPERIQKRLRTLSIRSSAIQVVWNQLMSLECHNCLHACSQVGLDYDRNFPTLFSTIQVLLIVMLTV